jgi:hypothetical protein
VGATAGIRRSVPRVLLAKREAAEAMGMSLSHFERYVQDRVPVIYSGSLRLYPLEGLQRWVEAEAVRPGGRNR